MWKEETCHSSVEKVELAEQCGKSKHSTCVEKVDMTQQFGKVDRVQLGGIIGHGSAAWKELP